MNLYLVGPGRKYEVYANANDPKKPSLHHVVGEGFTQKLVVYTDADYMITWAPADSNRVAKGVQNGKDFFVFRIPPTTHYGADGPQTVTQIEFDGRDVFVTTDEQLADVLDKARGT